MKENFYLIGKLGDDIGWKVYDLDSKTTSQNAGDCNFLEGFHSTGVYKKEVFKISRSGNRVYYTYVRYNLIGKRNGCILGFTYIYEDGGNIINDILGLRKQMKEALYHLLNGDNINIASFNDTRVTISLNHIKKFTGPARATVIANPQNPQKYPAKNPQDLTNDSITEILKNTVNFEISEEIPTTIEGKNRQIAELEKKVKVLEKLIIEKDSEIKKLSNEKDKDTTLIQNLTMENKRLLEKNSTRDKEIRQKLQEIDSLITPNNRTSSRERGNSKTNNKLKEYILWIIAILLVIDVAIGVYGIFKQPKDSPAKDITTEQTKDNNSTKTENTTNDIIKDKKQSTNTNVTDKDVEIYKKWKEDNQKDPNSKEIGEFTDWARKENKNFNTLSDKEKCALHKKYKSDLYKK